MEFDSYMKAGEILKKVREEVLDEISPRTKVLYLAEFIESRIKDLGGDPAFPVNISFDADAAHDTPSPSDTREIGKDSIVKIDIGVMVDGFIADSAFSLSFNHDHKSLINASKEALKSAIDTIRPGITPDRIGEAISDTILSFGFRPVENLTGHGLKRYQFHAEPTIPNVKAGLSDPIAEGTVIAIEPFATNGEGRVRNSTRTQIFQYLGNVPARTQEERRILEYAKNRIVPFSLRELNPTPLTKVSLISLVQKRGLIDYPVLTEVSGGLVSQTEHTVIVLDEPVVTTL